MCTAMKFTAWGYLIFITQTHKFKTDIEIELYQRIFAVVQCFITKEKGREPDNVEYNGYLDEMIRKEISVLFENLRNVGIVKETLEICDIREALFYLEKEAENVMKSSDLTDTQKWIYRVYHQATVITWNIYDVRVSSEVPLQYDIWKDISNEESYMNKEKEIEKLVDKTKISPLSKAITQILNSPVKYFNHRKELLDEEINFVFDNYEENCRNVFR